MPKDTAPTEKLTEKLDARLTDVEITMTHQEQSLQDISDVLTRQWSQIEKLESEIARLRAKLNSLEEAQADAHSDHPSADDDSTGLTYEKPPHY